MDDPSVYFGTRHGAKLSRNLDQIDWYFRTRFPAFHAGWARTRVEIEELVATGWKMIGEYNGSPILQLMPDRGGWKPEFDNPEYHQIGFWMDDDFSRMWVFTPPVNKQPNQPN